MAKMKFTMTQEDIDLGIPRRARKCAIARCMKRHGVRNVQVAQDSIAFYSPDGDYLGVEATTKEVADFISRYDSLMQNERLEPIVFEVEVRSAIPAS